VRDVTLSRAGIACYIRDGGDPASMTMTNELEPLLQEFPPAVREHLLRAWDRMPEATRAPLAKALRELPEDLQPWRDLINRALSHVQVVTGDKRRVAIVGPANVGKSTLYNQLVRSPKDHAEVSAVPGTTRVSQSADAGLFAVVDTPGADAVDSVGEEEKERAFATAREADFLVVVFDAIQGIKKAEQEMFRELVALGLPYVVVLNKIDLVAGKREQDRVVEAAARNLGLKPDQVLPCIAKDGKEVERVLLAVAKAEPQIMAALGAALPEYRAALAWSLTRKAGATAAAVALAPLPILDVFPLLAVQSSLVLGIARIYRQRITLARARELVVTFGLGFLGRTLFQELSKLGGPPGWLLSAAIASSTTLVMGRAAALWFERGERARASDLRAESRSLTKRMLESLKRLGRRRPTKEALKKEVEAVLPDTPPTGAPSVLPSAPAADEA
jgi:small GTP-binding protein